MAEDTGVYRYLQYNKTEEECGATCTRFARIGSIIALKITILRNT